MSRAETGELDRQIGGRIRTARLKLGLSQEKLGATLGVSFQQVQKYEKGTNRVSGARLLALCHALDVSIESLLSGSNNGGPKHGKDSTAFDAYLTTRHGVAVIRGMMALDQISHDAVLDLVKALSANKGTSKRSKSRADASSHAA